jgi:hypothetical protein
LTTSGNRSTAARSKTRPATTSRPAKPGESRPAAGGAPGAKALGFAPSQTVDREPYDLLFGQRQAPDGTQLGRPPTGGRKAADMYVALLGAEPHATAERRRDLRLQATKQARQSLLFFDLTISLSKSISLFHASLVENARLARQAGDTDGDGYWTSLVTEMDDMIWQAIHTGFGYFQREAGYTRTGSHNTRVHGRKPANGTRQTWRSRTGCSTPPGTETSSCTSTPRSPTSPAPAPTGNGAPGLTRVQRARRRDRLPPSGGSPHRPIRRGVEEALAGRAQDTHDAHTQTEMREDQAAAALAALTDGRRVSVINAPAGSGKTYVLAQAGRAWTAAGLGQVIGITASQSARNTLAAGVSVSYNSAQFLGHLPGHRGTAARSRTARRRCC